MTDSDVQVLFRTVLPKLGATCILFGQLVAFPLVCPRLSPVAGVLEEWSAHLRAKKNFQGTAT